MNAWNQHTSDLYLLLLHANFLRESESERGRFARRLAEAVKHVPHKDLEVQLCTSGWREMLSAAWLIGLGRSLGFQTTIREKLLASGTCFAGQGLCFALARFKSTEAADALCEYLTQYLPVGERDFDQEWAIGALAWLDQKLGSDRVRAFTADLSLWTLTAGGRPRSPLDPQRGIEKMRDIMKFVEEIGLSSSS